MTKNVFDGLYMVNNDVKILEQNQSLILQKLDRMESKVCFIFIFFVQNDWNNFFFT